MLLIYVTNCLSSTVKIFDLGAETVINLTFFVVCYVGLFVCVCMCLHAIFVLFIFGQLYNWPVCF
jgi:hypothetical protein